MWLEHGLKSKETSHHKLQIQLIKYNLIAIWLLKNSFGMEMFAKLYLNMCSFCFTLTQAY